jgi:hypothetical protein
MTLPDGLHKRKCKGARALTDVVVDFLHTVLFALSSIVAALVIVASIDWRVGAIVGSLDCGLLRLAALFSAAHPATGGAACQRAGGDHWAGR